MGKLLLLNDSFELANYQKEEKDLKVSNFCKMTQKAKLDNDIFYALPSLSNHTFSYGNFYDDFVFKEWNKIKDEPNIKGLSSTSHNLFFHLFFEYPSFAEQINSEESFNNILDHKGYAGFEHECTRTPFVKCISSWNIWKINWLSQNQDKISWIKKDLFLPNKEYSTNMLLSEILKHNKGDKLVKYKKNITITFHEEIMKYKGRDLITYTMKIGKLICESNYYIFENDLSKKEQYLTGSLRRIYSVINKEGEKQYISLDFRHGMFEFHNSKGEHLGEFHFDGSYNSKAEVDHNLKSLI